MLQPDAERLQRAQSLLSNSSARLDDVGEIGWHESSDQRLWHSLYDAIHELPFAYNANADANMTAASWRGVYVLHDLIVQRKRGWRHAGHQAVVAQLSQEARSVMLR